MTPPTPALIKDRRRARTASPYRTVLFLAFESLMLLVGVVVCSNVPSEALADKLFSGYSIFIGVIAGYAFGHSSIEKVANGKGIPGMVRVMMTSETPDDPTPAPPQPVPAAAGGAQS